MNDFINLARRQNNAKRNYLIINSLQCKNIPASPSRAIELFGKLSDLLKAIYKSEEILIVGFAETATAIGSQIAINLSSKYIQTTRENFGNVEYFYFSEEHSHATEQKIVKDDIDKIAKSQIKTIIFVDDEISTGKTIFNIVSILEKNYPNRFNFAVASILNGMSDDNVKIYNEKNINIHFLQKTNHEKFQEIAEKIELQNDENSYVDCYSDFGFENIKQINIEEKINARRLIDSLKYAKACEDLFQKLDISNICDKKILVLGTEEFMFPSIFVGKKLESKNQVFCHSTTRSPICVSNAENYPLHKRFELKSLYDKERTTFIYDLTVYDKIFILTDSSLEQSEGKNSLLNALLKVGNKIENIFLVKWM